MASGLHSISTAFPTFTGRETTEEKLERLCDYMRLQQQELAHLLQNLTPENFNKKALERMNQQQLEAIMEQVQRLLAEGEST